MVNRRSVLKGGIAVATASAVGISVTGTGGAQSDPAELSVNDFESDDYPEANQLDEWANHVAFEDDELADGTLRLEYDDGGFFATVLQEDLSDYESLELSVRGDDGGEEDEIDLRIGDVRAPLSELTDDSIGTTVSTVSVDLEDAGVDTSSVRQLRLGFWNGASGAIELDEIAFVGEGEGDGEYDGEITEDMTLAEFYPDYEEEEVGRMLGEYLPGEAGSGHNDADQNNWPDSEKAEAFDVDLEAMKTKGTDGTITFAEMGTQAIDHARQYDAEGFPRRANAKLLPRLAFLPDETEELTVHNPPEEVWDETAGPIPATNDPDQLIQEPWPTDARSYDPDGVAERDRAHDQPQHEDQEGWTTHDNVPDDRFYNDDNPIHEAATDKVHPATGESLGGDGFTANAPMTVETRIHVENDQYWYQILEFENTSTVPYYLNAAVIWWVGPMGGNGNLRDGHYNNEQRLSPGHGHPQRDVIAVSHDEDAGLTAYAIRLAFHDEPYHKRTAYPNQKWSLEVGTTRPEGYFETPEERQELVDTMAQTCHVEIETDMDRNDDLLDALDLRNRMTN